MSESWPMPDVRLTIRASGASRISPRAALVSRQAPNRLTSSVACIRSKSASVAGGSSQLTMPALLTSTSSRPWRSRTAASAASTLDWSVTSSCCTSIPESSVAPSGWRAPATTVSPAAASPSPTARPIPRLPPLISATRLMR